MNNGKNPLNKRNIMRKIYQYNHDIKSNNILIKERNDSPKDKNKSLWDVKTKKTLVNSNREIVISSYNKENFQPRTNQLLFNNNSFFGQNKRIKEVNNNLDNLNNEFQVNNFLKIYNSKSSLESAEWIYYNNLFKNIFPEKNNNPPKRNLNLPLINSFKYKNSIKKKFEFPPFFIHNKRRILKPDKTKSTINKNKIVINFKDKIDTVKKDLIEEKELNLKKRKLIQYYFLSEPGAHKGRKKINQDCYLVLPKNSENINNISIFGILNGHGPYGDILSKEICEYFSDFFSQKINFNKTEIISKPKIDIKRMSFFTQKINNKSQISFNSKNDSSIQKLKLINLQNNNIINDTYKDLSKDNFSKIYESYNEIDKKLHEEYKENKKCDDSGTSINLIIFFHFMNNINKIISVNLGNTKSILITDDKKIKELNIPHTPCVKEERLRIEQHGGIIDRIDWLKVGPLRVWFKGKKYPGLTITRSLGDFEAIPLGIIPTPDIKEYDIDDEKIKILVMATNGIWEFLTNDKIMDIAWQFYENKDAQGANEKIIETANRIWNIKNPHNIPDLTAGVFFFK